MATSAPVTVYVGSRKKRPLFSKSYSTYRSAKQTTPRKARKNYSNDKV